MVRESLRGTQTRVTLATLRAQARNENRKIAGLSPKVDALPRMRKLTLSVLWAPFGEILFGVWLFGWLPLKPPLWLVAGGNIDPPGVGYPRLARVIFLVLLAMLSLYPLIWFDTVRMRRRFPLRELPVMVRLVLASREGAIALYPMAIGAAVVAWFLLRNSLLASYSMRIGIMIVCGTLMILLLPPGAIVLGSSSPGSVDLVVGITRLMHPYRVVSLIEDRRLIRTPFAGKHDNLRTVKSASWRGAVHRLVEITPLVIVDTRFPTPNVCEEIKHMLDARRISKTLFVINEDGTAPGLEAVGVDLVHKQMACCSLRDVPAAIARFRSTGEVRGVS